MKQFTLDGYFAQSVADKIAQRMNGVSFLDFKVEVCNMAGNCMITVSSDSADSVEQLRRMFYFCALNELAQ